MCRTSRTKPTVAAEEAAESDQPNPGAVYLLLFKGRFSLILRYSYIAFSHFKHFHVCCNVTAANGMAHLKQQI